MHFSPLDRELLHSHLHNSCSDCTKCSLSDSRDKVVVSRGSAHSPRLALIGADPAVADNKSGLPFSGKAGILLDRMLKEAGFEPHEYYICNIVKCYAPEGFGESDAESCRPLLEAQLKIVQPKAIVTLGQKAFSSLHSQSIKISKDNGRRFDFHIGNESIPLYPLWHPSYVMKTKRLEAPYFDDFAMLRDVTK